MQVKLNSGYFGAASAEEQKSESVLEKEALLVYAGKFQSMDGEVDVTDDHIDRLATHHNSLLSKVKRMATGDVPAKFYPPIQLDHSTSATMTVGRLFGDLRVGDMEDEDGQKRKALYGRLRILGKENVEKVQDGRWTHLSIGADLESGKLNELTITPFPAAAQASLLTKGVEKPKDDSLGGEAMDPKEKERLGQYLCDVKKMEKEKVEEHLSKMSKEEQESLSKEADEHEAKMAAAKKEEEEKLAAKEKEEEEKKLSSRKAKAIELVKGFRTAHSGAKLAIRERGIHTRLAALKAQAKISPAEIKKIEVAKLAKENDATIEAVLSSYEKREPVIALGLYGSVQASTIADVQKNIEMANLEYETRMNMPSKKAELEKKKAEGVELSGEAAVTVPPAQQPQLADQQDPEYDALCKMMDEGKGEEVKAHLKKLYEKMRKLGYTGLDEGADAEKQMSALAEQIDKLHNLHQEVVTLVSEDLQISEAELSA